MKWAALPQWALSTAATAVFSNHAPPPNLKDLVGRIAPRPVFLIYATQGQGGEQQLNPVFYASAGEPKQLWGIPGSAHTGGISVRPKEYEQRVVSFFDRALLNGRQSMTDSAVSQPRARRRRLRLARRPRATRVRALPRRDRRDRRPSAGRLVPPTRARHVGSRSPRQRARTDARASRRGLGVSPPAPRSSRHACARARPVRARGRRGRGRLPPRHGRSVGRRLHRAARLARRAPAPHSWEPSSSGRRGGSTRAGAAAISAARSIGIAAAVVFFELAFPILFAYGYTHFGRSFVPAGPPRGRLRGRDLQDRATG